MADWLITALTAGGGALALAVSTRRWLARRHHRTSEVTLVCPRTGSPVRCRLITDERSGEHVGVAWCSRLPDEQPACDQDCVKLLNLGIRLAPFDPGQRDERSTEPAGGPPAR
ncbi:hypothetical protein [Sorangium sp. So ce1024]|uniref:hypothetical protein n=1 Tax=Sorangium sp. So ce1024 TaxID=3133327 RepID=UPI003F0A4B29